MILWSIVSCSQAALQNRQGFFICRAFLGLLEGGFIPDIVLWLSYWYKGNELPRRLSWFWTAYIVTNIVSAFLAFGILHMVGIRGLAGWRWLFALEGTLTGVIGIVCFFYLPPSPSQTAGRFRGKNGWFTEREEQILVTRVLRDDPTKSTMHNRQALSIRDIWNSLCDYDMWPIYILGLTWGLPVGPPTAYLTLSLRNLGFNTFQTNLLTIPAYVLFIGQILFFTWLSEKLNERLLICLSTQIWALPLLIALEVIPTTASNWTRYAILVLLVGYPYIHAILVALASRNANSVRTRTVASALYNVFVQLCNIVYSNIYRSTDAPYYYSGNKVLIGLCAMNIVLYLLAKTYYVKRNARRDAIWSAMSSEERTNYVSTTKDKGNKRLDFRFAH